MRSQVIFKTLPCTELKAWFNLSGRRPVRRKTVCASLTLDMTHES